MQTMVNVSFQVSCPGPSGGANVSPGSGPQNYMDDFSIAVNTAAGAQQATITTTVTTSASTCSATPTITNGDFENSSIDPIGFGFEGCGGWAVDDSGNSDPHGGSQDL